MMKYIIFSKVAWAASSSYYMIKLPIKVSFLSRLVSFKVSKNLHQVDLGTLHQLRSKSHIKLLCITNSTIVSIDRSVKFELTIAKVYRCDFSAIKSTSLWQQVKLILQSMSLSSSKWWGHLRLNSEGNFSSDLSPIQFCLYINDLKSLRSKHASIIYASSVSSIPQFSNRSLLMTWWSKYLQASASALQWAFDKV